MILAKLNIIPYFLWYNKEIEISIKENKILIENTESNYTKINFYQILILKYFPLFFLISFTFVLPANLEILIVSSLFICITILTYIYKRKHLIKLSVLFTILIYYFIYIDNVLLAEGFISTVIQFIFYSILLIDIWNSYYHFQYIYLKDISKKTSMSGTKKYPKIISKLWKKENTRNTIFSIVSYGYFIKLEKKEFENVN